MQYCPVLIRACCRRVEVLDGDLAEVGVWRGDSAVAILTHCATGRLYLYDTFCGMPAEMTLPREYHRPGVFGDTSLQLVKQKVSVWQDRVSYRTGVFPATADAEVRLKFCHVDCDQYLSTKAAIEWATQRLLPGGLILCDDYGCSSTPGAGQAINEWMAKHPQWVLSRHGSRGLVRHITTEALTL